MSTINHKITNRWPAENPEHIQLYSMPTPNGIKVSAMLEETGLDYDAHFVDIRENDQFTGEFLSLNPNNKIPAIIDPNGPNGEQIELWETGAILIYLAEKTGQFISEDPVKRAETIQWLMWQMGGVGPMFGQLGFFYKLGGKDIEDPRPRERYRDESKRLLGVLDARVADRTFIMGDEYSIADMAVWPWVAVLEGFYGTGEYLGLSEYKNVNRWLEKCLARPVSEVARNTPTK